MQRQGLAGGSPTVRPPGGRPRRAELQRASWLGSRWLQVLGFLFIPCPSQPVCLERSSLSSGVGGLFPQSVKQEMTDEDLDFLNPPGLPVGLAGRRIRLPMQETRIQSLGPEGPT